MSTLQFKTQFLDLFISCLSYINILTLLRISKPSFPETAQGTTPTPRTPSANTTTTATAKTNTATTPKMQSPINQYFPPSPPRSDKGDNDDEIQEVEVPLPPPSINPIKVLDIDLGTPDSHVPRDPRLIRLTGVHPFNVEAPLTALFDSGFLTPPELFYVRNHGAVPEVHDEDIMDWDISIEGLVENPMTISLRQILTDFENVTLPITLVCAGNRRKEQNMVQKSQGFSWGAAGVSTSLWTGPLISTLLAAAKPLRRARYLCMAGADDLPNGKYATSVRLSHATDPNRGIMLAHKQNGETLRPDHGKPLRVVVPGMIGGRSVKWLKKLVITEEPCDGWYHIYDNRVLPTMVTPAMAKENVDWWKDERYAIYELSVNSAVAYPQNDERLDIEERAEDTYTVRGYAYAGGGRRVTRVEVSLDKGKTWALAPITYPEDQYRSAPDAQTLYGGRLDMSWRDVCFCWCFWSLPVAVSALSVADDIVVRAVDESLAIQPRDTYWSVLGMMHNSWFRIAIRKEEDGRVLRFEHPTLPALMKGGWMERVNKEGGDLLDSNWGERTGTGDSEAVKEVKQRKKDVVKMTNDLVKRIIDIDELRKHDQKEEPWFVVNGEVYDGTGFLEGHPGGATSIIAAAGLDATDEFMGIHSENAKLMMPKYHIGSLSESSRLALLEQGNADSTSDQSTGTFLNPRAWSKATLIGKKVVSWDSRIFTFSLNSPEQILGLPVGQHLLIKVKDQVTGEVITRPYTPMSTDAEKGVVHLLIKIYFDTPTTKGGKMTMALDKLPMGHTAEFKGPIGKLIYQGHGNLTINDAPRNVDSFLMICAGSGITPIFQVLRSVLEDRTDPTQCVVLNGNRLEEDILCRDELDALNEANRDRCELVYTLTKPEKGWKGKIGRVDEDLVKGFVPAAEDGKRPLALICGPEALEKSVHGILKGMGWEDTDMVFF
ncbi:nitrate reductase [Morchella snyderi]|nr:nitrate reductase [Morchella snyderi]